MSGTYFSVLMHTLASTISDLSTGEHEFLDVWHESYAAIMRYARGSDGFWVINLLLCFLVVLIAIAVPECEHPHG